MYLLSKESHGQAYPYANNIIVQTRNKWLIDNDLVQQFISDNYTQVEGSSVDKISLHQTYRDWCEDNGIKHHLTMTKLKNELERKGITQNTNVLDYQAMRDQKSYYYEKIKAK